jgi:hypothetical protein
MFFELSETAGCERLRIARFFRSKSIPRRQTENRRERIQAGMIDQRVTQKSDGLLALMRLDDVDLV